MTKIPPCAIRKVWCYPLTPEEIVDVKGARDHAWAWACRCGKHGDSYATEDGARSAAKRHFDASQRVKAVLNG